MRSPDSTPGELPTIPGWFQAGFHRFLVPYLRRHFQAIAIESSGLQRLRQQPPAFAEEPLIVYANHPSWWDPLIAHLLNQFLFPSRQFWAPIDADALQQYQVFRKLGFFGVQEGTLQGAVTFLRTAEKVLAAEDDEGKANAALWITPEGRFADVRDRSASLMPGLAHLCRKQSAGHALPLAMEFAFWDERLPVCLIGIGNPIALADGDHDKAKWNETLTGALRMTQDELAELTILRRIGPFENLLVGKSGTGGIYDWLRRGKSWVTGGRFRASHGDQF